MGKKAKGDSALTEHHVELIESDSTLTIRIRGPVDFDSADTVRTLVLDALAEREVPEEVVLDLSEVETGDSSALGMLLRLRLDLESHAPNVRLGTLDPTTRSLLSLVGEERLKLRPPPLPPHDNPFVEFGEHVIGQVHDLGVMVQYIGRVTLSMLRSFRHPGRIRWDEVLDLMDRAGKNALPIVALMSLLVGLVLAFSSAVQLRQFGADIFIANLIGIGMTRELGPLLAAILLTGRSGSAFAAEIGTMQISDEIDALTVMRIEPLDYLVLPRIIAVMLALPLLTLFADVFGILGGIIVGIVGLDLTPTAFLIQLGKSIGLWDIFYGVIKAFFFGILVAGVGCYRGIQTSGGALGVGRSTTSSVVSGIFLIVLTDSLFVMLNHFLGFG